MGRKPKLSTEVKIELLEQYFSGGSPSKLSAEYGINVRTIEQWANRYREYGSEAFPSRQGNNSYTAEFKLQVVRDYMQSGVSEEQLALKYDIPDRSTIHKWINKYNGHKGNLKSYKVGRTAMTKARKTTLDERIGVVNYCIDQGLNYIAAAEKYEVSYNQVYSWVKKYKERGVTGLKDDRGKGKYLEDMNEFERLQAENKLLEARNRQLQMENDVLKKLEEIERRLISVPSGEKPNTSR